MKERLEIKKIEHLQGLSDLEHFFPVDLVQLVPFKFFVWEGDEKRSWKLCPENGTLLDTIKKYLHSEFRLARPHVQERLWAVV